MHPVIEPPFLIYTRGWFHGYFFLGAKNVLSVLSRGHRAIRRLLCNGVPTGAAFRRVFAAVLPAITDRPMRSLQRMTAQGPVCFERLFVGGAVPFFLLPSEPLLEGREEYLMDQGTPVLIVCPPPFLPLLKR